MTQRTETPTGTFEAGAAIALHLRVILTAGVLQLAGSTDVDLGTADREAFASGEKIAVRYRNATGTDVFVASGAITANNPVYAAAGGKVAGSGTILVGTAITAAASNNDYVEVLRIGQGDISASVGGTTAAAFLIDSDATTPKIELAAQTGGTGDYKATIKPPATLTGNRVFTLVGDAAANIVNEGTAQTLTNKTLTSPVLTTPTQTDLTEVVTATNVIAAAETGSTFFLNSATEFVSTLPAPAAGLNFRFIVSAAPSGASYTIVTNSSANIIKGNVVSSQDAGGNGDSETSGGDTISFVDGVAVAGDMVECYCDGTNWFVYGVCKTYNAITITTAS